MYTIKSLSYVYIFETSTLEDYALKSWHSNIYFNFLNSGKKRPKNFWEITYEILW
jgi:hypothetical protein